jgi:hypothetical protein
VQARAERRGLRRSMRPGGRAQGCARGNETSTHVRHGITRATGRHEAQNDEQEAHQIDGCPKNFPPVPWIFLEKNNKKRPATHQYILILIAERGSKTIHSERTGTRVFFVLVFAFSRPKSCCFGSQTVILGPFRLEIPRPGYRRCHTTVIHGCPYGVKPAQPAAEQRGWPRRAQRQAAPAASRHTQAVRVHTHVAARAWPPCTPCAAMPRGRCSRLARRCTPRAC